MRSDSHSPKLQYKLDKLLPEEEHPELDLALRLDHAQPGDRLLGEALLERWGESLYRLALALQPGQPGKRAVQAALDLTGSTVAEAISGPQSFRGEERMDLWLFKLMAGRLRRGPLGWLLEPGWRNVWISAHLVPKRGQQAAGDPLPGLPPAPAVRFESDPEQRARRLLDELPPAGRMAVMLRYLLNLEITAIARCLGASLERAQAALVSYRSAVFGSFRQAGYEWAPLHPDHSEHLRWLDAILDGRLTGADPRRTDLETHLESCLACRAYASDLKRLDDWIRAWLNQRYPPPPLDVRLKSHLVARLEQVNPKPGPGNPRLGFTRQAVAVLLLAVLLLGADWLLRRGARSALVMSNTPEPAANASPRQPTPAPNGLPPPIQRTPIRQVDSADQEQDPVMDALQHIYFREPGISAEGRWIVYSSLTLQGINGQSDDSSFQILLYDREAEESTPIFPASRRPRRLQSWNEDLSQPFLENTAGYDVASPGISADGRWVVFSLVHHSQLDWENQRCLRPRAGCAFIMLYDRETGRYRPVSSGYDGLPALGPVSSPRISADGRWIAFWSSAGNLVPGDDTLCRHEGPADICWDLFFYNRETRQLERLPVGRQSDEFNYNEQYSLSADGSRVALTVRSSDSLGKQLADEQGLVHPYDVYVLDRESGSYQPVNLTAGGQPGYLPSSLPALSPDGRLVAFASSSGNLHPDDSNTFSDVFIKDLESGALEWASQASNGASGNGDSGLVPEFGMNPGGNRLSFSADGRYIAFVSAANNLETGRPQGCVILDMGSCVNIYLHDRQSGTTGQVAEAFIRDGPSTSPLISADGNWVVSASLYVHCNFQDICSEIWLHERGTGHEQPINPQTLPPRSDSPFWTIQRLGIHDGAVDALAFSPDGQTIATGSYDNMVRLFRVLDGELMQMFPGHRRPVTSLAFSPDGKLLASASLDGHVALWSVESGALLQRLDHQDHELFSLAFSPRGDMLAVGAARHTWIWRVLPLNADPGVDESAREGVTGFLLARNASLWRSGYVNSLAFSPDGSLLALGMSDHTVWVERVSDGKVLLRLGGHVDRVLSVAFSPDGSYLASGSSDGKANLWQLYYAPRHNLQASFQLSMRHPGWVKSLAFTPDSRSLVSGSFDGGLRLWSVPDGALLDTFMRNYGEQLLAIAVSPDGGTLAAGSVRSLVRLVRFPVGQLPD